MRKKALLVNTATMKQPLLSILSFGVDNRTRSKTIEDYYEYYVLHQHGGGDGDDGDDYDEHCSEELRGRRRRGKGKICSRDEQYRADRCMALKLQRRLVEEEREEERLARRKDRRMWYEYFLKPYSVVVEKPHLFKRGSSRTPALRLDLPAAVKNATDSNDDEKRVASQRRCVDGTCALCLEEYEAGDVVVFSGNPNCKHVYHKECLMRWLSKGKKRCPVCQHCFVPGERIEDQKIAHGKAWQRALKKMERRREREDRDDRDSDETENEDSSCPQIGPGYSDDLASGVSDVTAPTVAATQRAAFEESQVCAAARRRKENKKR